jgi:hypothetical protein
MHPAYLRAAVAGYSALLIGWLVWPVAPGWPTGLAAAIGGIVGIVMSHRMFEDLDDDGEPG